MTKAKFTSASFYQALRDKRLMGTRCQECQTVYVPPRQVCPHCHSSEVEWLELCGEGKLLTFSTIAVGTSPMVTEGYNRNRHYCCGIVALNEGPKVCTLIVGVDAQNPDNIKIGTAVSLAFQEETDKPALLAFRVR